MFLRCFATRLASLRRQDSNAISLRCISPELTVRPEGANHQWRKNPPGGEQSSCSGISGPISVANGGALNPLDDNDKDQFKSKLVNFRNLYAFLAQMILRIFDLEKFYTYARFLLSTNYRGAPVARLRARRRSRTSILSKFASFQLHPIPQPQEAAWSRAQQRQTRPHARMLPHNGGSTNLQGFEGGLGNNSSLDPVQSTSGSACQRHALDLATVAEPKLH
jgi:hypothetical protein